ncbi:hypothetical protein KR51_00034170 [Rubidibacter lacunae KORDI 51-2]|uniref:Uncharacterized protein n=1 Tax=Rubidibacter lacunae KORDI 51-2 TaxID=582515 RepID=U5D671_9CHRO|nr:DUF4278 domain-containing protein [Rubidibacter lacunae]ERN40128.1 hypothetical protein KR51_00034170 [Rubidibacter lacunae KORDI 51-2]
MKYRGNHYTKPAIDLEVVREVEVGKYRGTEVEFVDLEAAVSHAAGRRTYRGVKF